MRVEEKSVLNRPSEGFLDKFKMGYFILWKNTGSLIGNQIERTQKKMGYLTNASQYVHIDVSGGGPYAVRVNPPRSKVVNILEYYEGREFAVIRFKGDEFNYKRYKVAFWAATHCNLMYDYWGVARFKIPFILNRKRLYFCSENALWSLQKEFPHATSLNPKECMPAEFFNQQFFEVVSYGRIHTKKEQKEYENKTKKNH